MLMTNPKKNSGMAEVGALVLLLAMSWFMYQGLQWWTMYQENKTSDVATSSFNSVVAAAMSYRTDKGYWPANIGQLIGPYIPNVESATSTPWGTQYQVSVIANDMIDVRVDAKTRKRAGNMASGIPNVAVSGSIVYAQFGKPGSEPALTAFLKRDGSTPLTGEWNVGGQAIDGVKDIGIQGLANRTVLNGLSWSNVQQNYQPVNFVSCPPGRSSLKLSVVPLSYSKNGVPFTNMGAVQPVWDGARAYVQVWEKEPTWQGWIIPAAQYASVLVIQSCSK